MAVRAKSTSKAKPSAATKAKQSASKAPEMSNAAKQTPAKTITFAEPVVKKKEMLARVAARAEMRPNQAKAVFDAVLEELGAALERGEKLRLPPLGNVKVNRQKELPDAKIVICKIRRNKAVDTEDAPLASHTD